MVHFFSFVLYFFPFPFSLCFFFLSFVLLSCVLSFFISFFLIVFSFRVCSFLVLSFLSCSLLFCPSFFRSFVRYLCLSFLRALIVRQDAAPRILA